MCALFSITRVGCSCFHFVVSWFLSLTHQCFPRVFFSRCHVPVAYCRAHLTRVIIIAPRVHIKKKQNKKKLFRGSTSPQCTWMFNGRSKGTNLMNNEARHTLWLKIVTCAMASSNAKRLLALRSHILPTTFFETNGMLGLDTGLPRGFDCKECSVKVVAGKRAHRCPKRVDNQAGLNSGTVQAVVPS